MDSRLRGNDGIMRLKALYGCAVSGLINRI